MYIWYLRTKQPSAGFPWTPPPCPEPELGLRSALQSIHAQQPTTSPMPHTPLARDVENYLADLDGTLHNPVATRILCAASTWAYSDVKTFAAMMCHRRLFGEFVGITVKNESALVDTTAYLFLSETRKLAILTFRGTKMTNLTNWLSNANTHMKPQEEGAIHGGFLNASIVVLPMLQDLLLTPDSLARGLLRIRDTRCMPDSIFPDDLETAACEVEDAKRQLDRWEAETRKAATPGVEDPTERKPSGPALYICGHSLGGAYAAMAAAMVQLEPTLKPIRRNLRSVYTFGQPMFADKTFADALKDNLGKRVFRHRYKKDIVPLLPGRSMGEFVHFGQSYVDGKGEVWVRETSTQPKGALEGPIRWTLLSSAIGLLSAAMRSFPRLANVTLPMSWSDHSPLHYMRISQAPRSGWELLGPELAGDIPGSTLTRG